MVYGIIAVVVVLFAIMIWTSPGRKWVANRGEPVSAWVVPVGSMDVGNSYIFMVVFAFDQSLKDVGAFLEGVVDRMMNLPGSESTQTEQDVTRWMREFFGSWELIRFRKTLPESLTQGRIAHCQNAYVPKSLLPGGKLTVPHIVLSLMREKHFDATMVDFPETRKS